MNPARLRKLKIAFSAMCAAACAVLTALWIQSYYAFPKVRFDLGSWAAILVSFKGEVLVRLFSRSPSTGLVARSFDVPYLAPVLVSGALAALPWVTWSRRFSIRALLIVSTLIAVVLGLMVAK